MIYIIRERRTGKSLAQKMLLERWGGFSRGGGYRTVKLDEFIRPAACTPGNFKLYYASKNQNKRGQKFA